MKIKIFCKIAKKEKLIEKRLADALVKMKRATYVTEAVAPLAYERKVIEPIAAPIAAPITVASLQAEEKAPAKKVKKKAAKKDAE